MWQGDAVRNLAMPASGIAVSAVVALWFGWRRGVSLGPLLAKLTGAALLVARIAFILQNMASYAGRPGLMLDITDGGFSAMAGLFTAFVIGAELTRHDERLRRPLVVAVMSGAVVWVGGTVATLNFTPARITVPLVEMRRLDGTPVQLRTLTNRPLVLNLWATWCPPCRHEMPILAAAQRHHPDVEFVFVNQREDAAAIRAFLAAQHLSLGNVFLDPDGAVASRTHAYAYPTTLFFDGAGLLYMRQVGGLSAAGLDERLAMLRQARP